MSAVPRDSCVPTYLRGTPSWSRITTRLSTKRLSTKKTRRDELEAWQIEAASVDRSVRILPGVKRLMNSIPAGRYAVATSGAKTYGKLPLSPSSHWPDLFFYYSSRMHDSRRDNSSPLSPSLLTTSVSRLASLRLIRSFLPQSVSDTTLRSVSCLKTPLPASERVFLAVRL